MTDTQYEILELIPPAKVYLDLNLAVGWGKTTHVPSVDRALANSLVCFCAVEGEKVVGFVRVVGDSSICFYIQDLIVHPDHQGKGLGKRLMDRVMEFIKPIASSPAFVGLMAAPDAEAFYNGYGFTRRSQERPGMELVIRKDVG